MKNLTKQELLFLTIKSLDILNYEEINLKNYILNKKLNKNLKNFQIIKKILILQKILEKNTINIENQIKLYIICLDKINNNLNKEKILNVNEIKSKNYYSFFQFFNKFTYYLLKKSLKNTKEDQINSLNKINRNKLVYEGLYLVLKFLSDHKKTDKSYSN